MPRQTHTPMKETWTMIVSEILASITGLTYRQLDHWITKGYLRTVEGTRRGYGFQRALSPREVRVLRVMHELVQDGVNPEQAVKMARRHVNRRPVFLGGFQLTRKGDDTNAA